MSKLQIVDHRIDGLKVPGEFLCRIREVREEIAAGKISFCLVLDGGEHDGKILAWDVVSFTDFGLKRLKTIITPALQLGEGVDPTANLCVGKRVRVRVEDYHYIAKKKQQEIYCYRVTKTGWRKP